MILGDISNNYIEISSLIKISKIKIYIFIFIKKYFIFLKNIFKY